MEKLDAILDGFTDPATGSLHGVAFIAVDRSGKPIYQRASGRAGFGADSTKPLPLDSLYWIASMTKLATAVSVVQLVEGGVLSLDDDVREKLPELKDIQILQSAEPGYSKLSPVEGKLTLRYSYPLEQTTPLTSDDTDCNPSHLLCHTSGFIYDSYSPLLQQWSKDRGRSAHTFCGSMAGYDHPLLFQPGTSWGYGAGLDWAGRLVEHVTGSTLEQYMQTNIWSKLGARSTTFHPEWRTSTLPPLLEMGKRVSTGQGIESVKQGRIILEQPLKNDLGGIGLFSTPTDYMQLLAALLQDGGPLLSRESVDLLFQPQLGAESRAAMPKLLGGQMRRVLGIKSAGDTTQADHCLGGTVTLKDVPGRRRRGSVNWSGLPNLHWWIDRETGIAGGLFTQLMPLGDASVAGLLTELEMALYRAVDREAHSSSDAKL